MVASTISQSAAAEAYGAMFSITSQIDRQEKEKVIHNTGLLDLKSIKDRQWQVKSGMSTQFLGRNRAPS
ncbi:hypothetical protein N0V84_007493 [Fusarium piperis]|uniref:Uncharacterized protein n=1 Tax=Fusarium piperis TaxID=1435070 RepID=A0A9W8W9W6_9HYPO|nr:hypothetical protein N0V84_007493 [Fusarium piperis]